MALEQAVHTSGGVPCPVPATGASPRSQGLGVRRGVLLLLRLSRPRAQALGCPGPERGWHPLALPVLAPDLTRGGVVTALPAASPECPHLPRSCPGCPRL